LEDCRGLTPVIVTELSGISSIRRLEVHDSILTDEGLNLVWSRLPYLEMVSLMGVPVSAEGFRDIKKARNLKRLALWKAPKINDELIARMAEAPALETLWLGHEETSSATAALFSRMPALQLVYWLERDPDAGFVAELKAFKPQLSLRSVAGFELPVFRD
jgi:hypothetical protein